MSKITIIINALIITLTVIFAFTPEFDKKYCDKSLSEEKISELEKCENNAPNEIKEPMQQCLTEISIDKTFPNGTNKEFAYKDLIKAYCDMNSRKLLNDCNNKKVESLKKAGNLTDTFLNTEVMIKIENCMKKVLGITL